MFSLPPGGFPQATPSSSVGRAPNLWAHSPLRPTSTDTGALHFFLEGLLFFLLVAFFCNRWGVDGVLLLLFFMCVRLSCFCFCFLFGFGFWETHPKKNIHTHARTQAGERPRRDARRRVPRQRATPAGTVWWWWGCTLVAA